MLSLSLSIYQVQVRCRANHTKVRIFSLHIFIYTSTHNPFRFFSGEKYVLVVLRSFCVLPKILPYTVEDMSGSVFGMLGARYCRIRADSMEQPPRQTPVDLYWQ